MTTTRPSPLRIALLAAVVLLGQAVPARAQTAVLTVNPLDAVQVGRGIDITAGVVGANGAPVAEVPIEVYLGDSYLRRALTDDAGRADIRIGQAIPVGRYTLTLVAVGDADRPTLTNTIELEVRPLVLTIETVPPLAGIPFRIGERTVVTDDTGVARATDLAPERIEVTPTIGEDHAVSHNTRVSFDRWGDAVFTPERTVDMRRGDKRIQIGFALSHSIPTTFVDLAGGAVGWDEISDLTLKSSAAAYRTVTDGEPIWLQANRIMRQRDGIFPTPLLWSVESVTMDGSNVVNRNQQRFFVEPDDSWELELLLYSVRFRSRDALLGFSVGDGVQLTYPDGTVVDYPFDSDREVRLYNLARGNYRVQVTGTGGVAPLTPVALSRDQDVALKVLTTLDIWIGIGVGVTLALGLLIVGRPQMFGLRRRRSPVRARHRATSTEKIDA